MAVAAWIAGRVAVALLTTIAASALSYTFIRLVYPEAFGDPRPLLTQLWEFLERLVLHLDLGYSSDWRQQFRPVDELLAAGLPVDAAMFGGALVIGIATGLAGGNACARRPRGLVDRVLSGAALVVLSAPVYWVGFVVIIWFGRNAGLVFGLDFVRVGAYVPPGEDPLGWLAAMAVPWCVAGAPLAAICLRLSRSALIETAGEDYVRTAHGKGLSQLRVAVRHALPPALPSTVGLAGAYAPLLVGNALLVEIVFNIPGVFRDLPDAIDGGDFPLIQGLIVAGAVLVAVTNLVGDLVLAWLDPRTRPG